MRTVMTPDMTPEAVDRRLREVAQLHRLGMSILEAKRIGKVGEVETEMQEQAPEVEGQREVEPSG